MPTAELDKNKYDSNKTVKRLYDQDKLLDVLIEFEAVLDSLDLYAFKNWFEGEIVSGPWLERYWVRVTLKYPYKKMPDPQGGNRLLKHGAYVTYELATEKKPVDVTKIDHENRTAYYNNDGERKEVVEKIWLVHIDIPRRFIEDMETGILDLDTEDDEEIDLTAAQGAEEEGIADGENLENEPDETDEEEFDEL